MSEKPTDGYADRLELALERGPHPMSVRQFQEHLAEKYPDLRGTSYGGVRQYAEGRVSDPRVDLLRAMADVLGVRGDWLAFDEGEMTEEAEQQRVAAEKIAAGEDLTGIDADIVAAREQREAWEQEVRDTLRSAFGVETSPVSRAVFVRARNHVNADPAIQYRTTGRLAMAGFANALAAPFGELKEGHGWPDETTVETYIMEAAMPLARAIRDAWAAALDNVERTDGEG